MPLGVLPARARGAYWFLAVIIMGLAVQRELHRRHKRPARMAITDDCAGHLEIGQRETSHSATDMLVHRRTFLGSGSWAITLAGSPLKRNT